MQQRAYSSSKPLKQLLRSCRDGGIPSHPVDSGEFKRLPGWDHQLTMCNTEYFNVTWNKNGSELYTGSAPADYSTSIIGNGASSNSQSAAISRGSDDGPLLPTATVQFLHDVAVGMGDGKPFHVVAGVRAPHNPMTPAPWCPSPSLDLYDSSPSPPAP